jgi:hypothetical protein
LWPQPAKRRWLEYRKHVKSYGGKQRVIQPSLIREERGYLGSFNRNLNPDDTQHFIFSKTDEGPFWMNPVKQEE